MTKFILFFLFSLSMVIFSIKKNLLPNFSGAKHQLFLKEKKVPLIGGILIFFPIIYFFYQINLISIFFIFLILFIGFLSDLNILKSPKIRFFLQIIIIYFSVYILEIYISDTRIEFLDNLLNIKFFSIFFSIFCLMVLLNGSNFIDGLNGLLFGYVFIVLIIIYKLNLFNYIVVDINIILFLFYCFSLLIILNFLNLLYLGDGGSYLLGFFLGYLTITIYNLSNNISPFFIILLLWYPCFENLFSIIRKFKLKNSPLDADNMHLHQLFYFFFRNKFFHSNRLSNNFSSITIISYNFIIMFIGSLSPTSSNFQATLIILNIIIYLISYKYLFSFRFCKKK